MKKPSESSLFFSEWLFVFIFIILLSTIIIVSKASCEKGKGKIFSLSQTFVSDPEKISVYIEGEVENPGTYLFDKGISPEGVFNKAVLKKNADITKIKLNKTLRKSTSIFIPELQIKNKKGKR